MQSADSLIQDYLAALRILDLEGPLILGHDATAAYRRRLLSASRNWTGTAESCARTAARTVDSDDLTASLAKLRHAPTTVIFQESTVVVHLSVFGRRVEFLEWLTRNEKRQRQNRCVSWRSAGGRRRH